MEEEEEDFVWEGAEHQEEEPWEEEVQEEWPHGELPDGDPEEGAGFEHDDGQYDAAEERYDDMELMPEETSTVGLPPRPPQPVKGAPWREATQFGKQGGLVPGMPGGKGKPSQLGQLGQACKGSPPSIEGPLTVGVVPQMGKGLQPQKSVTLPGKGGSGAPPAKSADALVEIIQFDKMAMGSIIGHAGANITDVRQGSGAEVRCIRTGNTVSVHLEGTKDQIEDARAMIVKLVGEEPVETDGQGEDAGSEVVLEFDKALMGSIIGTGGARIKEVRELSGADVRVKKLDDRVEVRISGTDEQVQQSKAMVHELAEKGQAAAAAHSSGPETSMTLEYDVSAFGNIIGSGGAHIKEVRHVSGAEVSVEKLNTHTQVKISGTSSQMEKAQAMITELATAKQTPKVTETLEFEKTVMGSIIGPGGARVKDVRAQSGAEVRVKGVNDVCEVQILGTSEQVQKAKALVTETAESCKRADSDSGSGGLYDSSQQHQADGDTKEVEDEETLSISQNDAKKIIGKSGTTAKRIRSESGAIVKIDVQPEDCTASISGTVEAVDRARSMIHDLLKSTGNGLDVQWESEEFLQVSYIDSKKIIGRAGANIHKIEQSTWAKVEIDRTDTDYRLVRVTGSLEAVDQAISMIQQMLESTSWQNQKRGREWSKTNWSKDDWDGKSVKRKWNSNDWQDWETVSKKQYW